jgi:hypothetical protein
MGLGLQTGVLDPETGEAVEKGITPVPNEEQVRKLGEKGEHVNPLISLFLLSRDFHA